MQFTIFIHGHHIASVKEPTIIKHFGIYGRIVHISAKHLMPAHPQNTDAIFVFITNFAFVISGRPTKGKRETFFSRLGNTDWPHSFGQTISLNKRQPQPFIERFNLGLGGGTTGNQQLCASAKHVQHRFLNLFHQTAQADFLQYFTIF